jgi:hypothetical protein
MAAAPAATHLSTAMTDNGISIMPIRRRHPQPRNPAFPEPLGTIAPADIRWRADAARPHHRIKTFVLPPQFGRLASQRRKNHAVTNAKEPTIVSYR